MSININNDNVILNGSSAGTGSVAETVAGQEEIYLEKTEEELRAILISEDPSTYMQQETALPGFIRNASGYLTLSSEGVAKGSAAVYAVQQLAFENLFSDAGVNAHGKPNHRGMWLPRCDVRPARRVDGQEAFAEADFEVTEF